MEQASGYRKKCRERNHIDAIPRTVLNGGGFDLSEDEEDVGMMSSRRTVEEELDHKRCGRLRTFWTLHKGLVLAFLSCVAQAVSSIGVKMLAGSVPPTEVATFRLVSYFVVSSVCLLYFKIPLRVTLKQLRWLLLRVTVGTIAMCLCFYSFQNIPVADTTAILFSSPIFTGIFAWILLGERFTLVDAALASFTLIGIVLIARPSFIFGNIRESSGEGNAMLGVITAVIGALFVSTVYVILRKLGGINVHPLFQVWFFGVAGLVMTFLLNTIAGFWVIPRCGKHRLVLIVISFLGFLAQITMSYALKSEKAAYVAVVKSNNIILAFLLEFAIFGTVPYWLSIIGVFLVMFSSLGITIKKWMAAKSKKKKEDGEHSHEDVESDSDREANRFDVAPSRILVENRVKLNVA